MTTTASPAAYRMVIEPQGWAVDVPRGVALLTAAREAGISLPSSCRNGTCRACLCRVVHGRAAHLIPWPGLSAEEKEQGFILPCVAVAESALTVQVTGARRIDAPAA